MPTPLLGPLVRRPLLVVALLAVTLFALLPAVTSAQDDPGLPPRQFWGSNDTVTIGGEPWDGSTIVVINEAGDVIATVERESTAWSVEISNDVVSFRFRASNGGVSEVYSPGEGAIREDFTLMIGSPPGEVPTRAVALEEDFNFIVWTGHTTAIDDALAGFPDRSELTAIWEFDTGSQKWKSFRPGRPAFLQYDRRPTGRYRVLPSRGRRDDLGHAHHRRSGRHADDRRRLHGHWLGWDPMRRRRTCWTPSRTRTPWPRSSASTRPRRSTSRTGPAGPPAPRASAQSSPSTCCSSARPRPPRSRSSAGHLRRLRDGYALTGSASRGAAGAAGAGSNAPGRREKR